MRNETRRERYKNKEKLSFKFPVEVACINFKHEPNITNIKMWEKLKEHYKSKDSIIQEVTSWSAKNPSIYWISDSNNERIMKKGTFQKRMSALRNPK